MWPLRIRALYFVCVAFSLVGMKRTIGASAAVLDTRRQQVQEDNARSASTMTTVPRSRRPYYLRSLLQTVDPTPSPTAMPSVSSLPSAADGLVINEEDSGFSEEERVIPCGPVICVDGDVCCNESCGICTKPDYSCTQIFCGAW
ncbi:hypothetical protein ACA910_014766 [Epithemia clementina (nom. ined.)]